MPPALKNVFGSFCTFPTIPPRASLKSMIPARKVTRLWRFHLLKQCEKQQIQSPQLVSSGLSLHTHTLHHCWWHLLDWYWLIEPDVSWNVACLSLFYSHVCSSIFGSYAGEKVMQLFFWYKLTALPNISTLTFKIWFKSSQVEAQISQSRTLPQTYKFIKAKGKEKRLFSQFLTCYLDQIWPTQTSGSGFLECSPQSETILTSLLKEPEVSRPLTGQTPLFLMYVSL